MPAGVAAEIGKFPVYKTILTVYHIKVTRGLVQTPFLCGFHLSGSRMRVNLGSTNVATSAHLRPKAAPDCSMPTAGGTSVSLWPTAWAVLKLGLTEQVRATKAKVHLIPSAGFS